MKFFPSCGWISTIVWMHHMDASKTHGEKVRWELHKSATCYFKQILEAILHQAMAVWPLNSHLKKYPHQISKTWGTQLEKQEGTHKWHSFSFGRPARINLHQICADTECRLEDLPRVMNDRNGWGERVREIHAISTTLYICIYIYTHTHTHTWKYAYIYIYLKYVKKNIYIYI